jgi:hypothetical protein
MFPDGAISADQPQYLKKVGQRTVPQVEYSSDGSFASLSIEHEKGPHEVEIAVLQEGNDNGPAFWARKEAWDSGAAQQAFEDCDQPGQVRVGFLKLRKQAVCEALRSLT